MRLAIKRPSSPLSRVLSVLTPLREDIRIYVPKASSPAVHQSTARMACVCGSPQLGRVPTFTCAFDSLKERRWAPTAQNKLSAFHVFGAVMPRLYQLKYRWDMDGRGKPIDSCKSRARQCLPSKFCTTAVLTTTSIILRFLTCANKSASEEEKLVTTWECRTCVERHDNH